MFWRRLEAATIVLCLAASTIVTGPAAAAAVDDDAAHQVVCDEIANAIGELAPGLALQIDGCDPVDPVQNGAVDCSGNDPNVLVVSPDEPLPSTAFGPGVTALKPGRFELPGLVWENFLTADATVVSCDPNDRALIVGGTDGANPSARYGGGRTVTFSDVDFEFGSSGALWVRTGATLIVERARFFGITKGTALKATEGASLVVRDVEISAAERGIDAESVTAVDLERVRVTDSEQYGILIDGDRVNPAGFRPVVSIADVTVLNTGVSGFNGSGIFVGTAGVTMTDTTVACSRNANVRVFAPDVSADGSSFTASRLTLGASPDGLPCSIPQRFGVFASGDLPISIIDSTLANGSVGSQFQGPDQAASMERITFQGNDVGVASEGRSIKLTSSSFVGNQVDCDAAAGLIVDGGGNVVEDTTCFGAPAAPCTAAPAGAAVLEPGDDLGAALKAGGAVYLQPGDYPVSVEVSLTGNVDLGSCDVNDRAHLVQTGPCNRVLLVEGPAGVMASVHDLVIQGGSAGLTVRGGMDLQTNNVNLSGTEPACDGDDRVLEVSGGSTATIEATQISNGVWGVRLAESGDVTFTDVTIRDNDEWGIRAFSANVANAPRPTMVFDNVTVIDTQRPGSPGHGVALTSVNAKIVDSTIACNQNANLRVATFDAATDEVDLTIDVASIGQTNDEVGCAPGDQFDGIEILGRVNADILNAEIDNHDNRGVVFDGGVTGLTQRISGSSVTSNKIGIETTQPLTLSGTSVIGNALGCAAAAGLIDDAGGNEDDGTCFARIEAQIVPKAFSTVTASGLGLLEPVELTRIPNGTMFSIELDEPAPVSGVEVDWRVEPLELGFLPAASGQFLLQLEGTALFSEGESTVDVELSQTVRVPGSEAGAFRISLPDHPDTEMLGVTEPGEFLAEVSFLPNLLVEGETGIMQIEVRPAAPFFLEFDPVPVSWQLGPDATQFQLGLGTELLRYSEADFLAERARVARIPITPIVDDLQEGVRSFFAQLSTFGGPSQTFAGLSVLDRGGAGDLAVSVTGADWLLESGLPVLRVSEGNADIDLGAEQFTIRLAEPVADDVEVDWEIVGFEALSGFGRATTDDFAIASGTVVVLAGEVQAPPIDVIALADADVGVEGFAVRVTSVDGEVVDDVAPLAGVIENQSDYELSVTAEPAVEGARIQVEVTVAPADPLLGVELIGEVDGLNIGDAVQARVRIDADGAAPISDGDLGDLVLGQDLPVDLVFSVEDGDTPDIMRRIVEIATQVDDAVEGAETFVLTAETHLPSGIVLSTATGTGSITDPELVEVAVEVAPVRTEGVLLEVVESSGIELDVTISPAGAQVEIPWRIVGNGTFGDQAVSADDLAQSSGTLILGDPVAQALAVPEGVAVQAALGSQRSVIPFAVDGDEPAEGFQLVLDPVDGFEGLTLFGIVHDTVAEADEASPTVAGVPIEGTDGELIANEAGQPEGVLSGNLTLPDWNGFELPVDLVFADGRVSVSYAQTFESVSIGAPAYFELVNPAIAASASADLQSQIFLDLSVTADAGLLFPGSVDLPVQATVSGLSGNIGRGGVTQLRAESATGTFGQLSATVTGPVVSLNGPVTQPFFEAPEVEAAAPGNGGFAVTRLTVDRNGAVDFDQACLDNQALAGLSGTISVAGFAFDIERACVVSIESGEQVLEVTGSFDVDVEPLDVTVTVGDQPPGSFTFRLRTDGLSAPTPLDLGPITVAIAPFSAGGFTAEAALTINGYRDGVFDGGYEGSVSISGDAGLGATDVTVDVSGAITRETDGAVLRSGLEIFAEVDAQVEPIAGLIEVADGSLGVALELGSEAERFPVLAEPELAGPLFDRFRATAAPDDITNAYLLAFLSTYTYPDAYPTQFQGAGDFAAIAAGGLETTGLDFVEFIQGGNTSAQIIAAETDDALLIAFRGSDDATDWIGNVQVIPNALLEHAGFGLQASEVESRIRSLIASRSGKAIWITGHSRGGAAASALVERMHRDGVAIQGLVTFGAPATFFAPNGVSPATFDRAVRFVDAGDVVPGVTVPFGYVHLGAPRQIVFDPFVGDCTGISDFVANPLGYSVDDHSIARYATRILNLAPIDVQIAVASAQSGLPSPPPPPNITARCDEAARIGSVTTSTIVDGPTITAGNLGATIRIPGITDVAGNPVAIAADVSFDDGVWRAEVALDVEQSLRFRGLDISALEGALAVDVSGPSPRIIDADFDIGIEVVVDDEVEAQDVTFDLTIEDGPSPETLLVTATGSTSFEGDVLGGAISVTDGELIVGGSAIVGFGDVAASRLVGIDVQLGVTEASLNLGSFTVDLGEAQLTIDGDDATPLLELASATGSLLDPNDPDRTLAQVAVSGIVVADDGSIAIESITGTELDNLAESIGLAGVVPYVIEGLEIEFPDPGDFERFELTIDGRIDLSSFGERDVRVSVGDPDPPSCAEPAGDRVFDLDFAVSVESLSTGAIAPKDLADIYLAACNIPVGPYLASGSVFLGGYVDGELQGEAAAAFELRSVDDAGVGGPALAAEATVSVELLGGGAARLVVDGSVAVSGEVDEVIEVDSLSLGFGFDIEFDPTPPPGQPVAGIDDLRFNGATVDRLVIQISDVVRFIATDVEVFAEPDVVVAVRGESASVAVEFGSELDVLDGWGGRAGNFTVVSTPAGLDVRVEPGFFVAVTSPDDAELGLPNWLPFEVSEAEIAWPTLEPGDSLRDALAEVAAAQVTVSGGLVERDGVWPFTAQVDGLVVDLGVLGEWLAGDVSRPPIVGLEGIRLGVEPRSWGPATVGGELALGFVVHPDTGEAVWFGRLFGEFGIDGFDLGLDMVMSEYGPIAASFQAPAAVPIGPSGFVLSGVSGGLDFDRRIPSLPALECAGSPGEGDFSCADGSSPLALLTGSDYDFSTPRNWSFEELQEAVVDQVDAGGSFLPDNVTMYLGGSITHVAAAGAISGEVLLAANIDGSVESNGLRLLGTGDISIWGVDAVPLPGAGGEAGDIARVGVLLDVSEPLEPVFSAAMQMPSGDDWVSAVLPIRTQFGVTLDTAGLAEALPIAMEEFRASSAQEPRVAAIFGQYATFLNRNRSFEMARLIEPDRSVPITAEMVDEKLQAFLADRAVRAQVASAVLGDLMLALADPVEVTGDLLASRGDQPSFGEALEQTRLVLERTTNAAINAAATLIVTADPKFFAEGNAQMALLGVPFGNPQAVQLFIDKNGLVFGATGSITDTIRAALCGPIPGCAQAAYLLGAGFSDSVTVALGVPFDLESLLQDRPFEAFSPFGSEWSAEVNGSLTFFGYPLTNATGLMLGPDQADRVATELADKQRFSIEMPDAARQVFGDRGGLVMEANVALPEFITDPGARIDALADGDCFEFPDLVDLPEWFQTCVEEAGQSDTLGAAQLFAAFPNESLDAPSADDLYLRGEFDLSLLGMPLGDAQLEATPNGLQFTARPPFAPQASATRWVFTASSRIVEDVEGNTYELPIIGFEGALTTDDFDGLLDELGIDAKLFSNVRAGVSARGYTPGFSSAPDADELQRLGGIELVATASIADFVEEVELTFRLTPNGGRGALPFDVVATGAISNARVGGVVIESGSVEIRVAADVAEVVFEIDGSIAEFGVVGSVVGTTTAEGFSGRFDGAITLPDSFAVDGGANTIEASGQLGSNGDFSIVFEQMVDVGPLRVDGQGSLSRSGGPIEFAIGPRPGQQQAMVSVRSDGKTVFAARTTGIRVDSLGVFSGDLEIDPIGNPDFVALAGLEAQVAGDLSTESLRGGDNVLLDLEVTSGGLLLGFLAQDQPGSFPETPLGGGTTTLRLQRNGDLTASVTMRPVDLDVLRLETATVEISVVDDVVAVEGDFDASIVLGDDVSSLSLDGLRLDSSGGVSGRLTAELELLGAQLGEIDVALSSPTDQPGVIRFDFAAELGGSGLFGGLAFAGFAESDGTFDIRADASFGGGFTIPIINIDLEASLVGSVILNNTGASFAGTARFSAPFVDCSAAADLAVYSDPGIEGNVTTECDGLIDLGTFSFALPFGFEPSVESPVPQWVFVPSTTTLTTAISGAQIAARYDMPSARNGNVTCDPAIGDGIFGSTTVECEAVSPTGEKAEASFWLQVEVPGLEPIDVPAGVLILGGIDVLQAPAAAGSVGGTTFLQTAAGKPKPLDQDDDERLKVTADVGFAGFTSAMPGTKVTGIVESDPILVFEVDADASGIAAWAFDLPAELPAGDHTLYVSGLRSDGSSFIDVLPLVLEVESSVVAPVAQTYPLPSGSSADGEASDAGASAAGTADGGQPSEVDEVAGAAGGSEVPLAHTGFAGRSLVMMAVLMLLGGTALVLGARRKLAAARLH